MNIDTNSAAALKQFVTQMTTVRDNIAADTYKIDGGGETLTVFTGMVVQQLGADIYAAAQEKVNAAVSEKAKVMALLDHIIAHFDQQEKLMTATVGLFGSLGISGIKIV